MIELMTHVSVATRITSEQAADILGVSTQTPAKAHDAIEYLSDRKRMEIVNPDGRKAQVYRPRQRLRRSPLIGLLRELWRWIHCTV